MTVIDAEILTGAICFCMGLIVGFYFRSVKDENRKEDSRGKNK